MAVPVPDPTARRPAHPLWSVLIGLAIVALVLSLPDLVPDIQGGQDAPVDAYHGRITTITPAPTGSDPDSGLPPVTTASVEVFDGPMAGQVVTAYLVGPGGAQSAADYRAGDDVVLTVSSMPDADAPYIAVSDRWRLPGLAALVALFAAAVLVVGGWQGARALVALGLTVVVILKVLLPLLIAGYPPVALAVIVASAVTVATILLTEGAKRSSLAAILGTTGALALTGLLAAAATAALGFTDIAGSDLAFYALPDGRGLDLRGLLLAAMIIGAVGVLDDVTVTQAVLVDELADAGGLEGRALGGSAMVVGRSHIAATVNTLFLAYVGAGLPLLVVLLLSHQPAGLVLNDEVIVTEIVRTLVGGLGIVAAIPFTTFVAVALRDRTRADDARTGSTWHREPARSGPSRAVAAGAVVGGLLVLTAVLPLTAGPRAPLAPEQFGTVPSATTGKPPIIGPTSPPGVPAPPAPDIPAGLVIADVGEPVAVSVDGSAVGTASVELWDREAGDVPAVTVDVHYEATDAFSLASGRWALLYEDDSEFPLTPVDGPAALDRTLDAGESLDVELRATGVPPGEPSVLYLDAETGGVIFGVPLT